MTKHDPLDELLTDRGRQVRQAAEAVTAPSGAAVQADLSRRAGRRRRRQLAGAFAAAGVLAVVVGAAALSGGWFSPPTDSIAEPTTTQRPATSTTSAQTTTTEVEAPITIDDCPPPVPGEPPLPCAATGPPRVVRVVDENGKPVVGAEVMVEISDDPPLALGVTDDDGTAMLPDNLPLQSPGEVVVTGEAALDSGSCTRDVTGNEPVDDLAVGEEVTVTVDLAPGQPPCG